MAFSVSFDDKGKVRGDNNIREKPGKIGTEIDKVGSGFWGTRLSSNAL
jgi:hypothetical protein